MPFTSARSSTHIPSLLLPLLVVGKTINQLVDSPSSRVGRKLTVLLPNIDCSSKTRLDLLGALGSLLGLESGLLDILGGHQRLHVGDQHVHDSSVTRSSRSVVHETFQTGVSSVDELISHIDISLMGQRVQQKSVKERGKKMPKIAPRVPPISSSVM